MNWRRRDPAHEKWESRQQRDPPKFDGPFDAYKLRAQGCDVLFASYPAD